MPLTTEVMRNTSPLASLLHIKFLTLMGDGTNPPRNKPTLTLLLLQLLVQSHGESTVGKQSRKQSELIFSCQNKVSEIVNVRNWQGNLQSNQFLLIKEFPYPWKWYELQTQSQTCSFPVAERIVCPQHFRFNGFNIIVFLTIVNLPTQINKINSVMMVK